MRRILQILAVYFSGCLGATAAVISLDGNLAGVHPDDGLLRAAQLILPDYQPMGVLDTEADPAEVFLAAKEGRSPSLAGSQCRATTAEGCQGICCNYDLATGAEPVGFFGFDISTGAIPVPEPSARTSFIVVATVVLIWLWRHVSPTR